ncbi:STM3941 family protein [Virgibacillus halodenitrificans]|uniref:STM3941 family protein n=1 Tax=Virgibacillus halodenitrificans TaxID=1482 RepID=UPI0007621EB5
MEEFVVYPKKKRMVVLALFSTIFVFLCGGIFLLLLGDGATGVLENLLLVLMPVCAAFFAIGTYFFTKSVIKRKPAVIVSKEGITDKSTMIGPGLIKWQEIEKIDVVSIGGQPHLAIFTYDPDAIRDRSTGLVKVLNSLNKGLVSAQANIPLNNLDCSIDDLFKNINDQWETTMNSMEPEEVVSWTMLDEE